MAIVDLPPGASPRLDASPPAPVARPPRRPANALLLMALAGLLFFVASYAALRDRDITYSVVYARSDIAAGTTLRAEDLGRALVQVDERVLAGLVRADGSAVGAVAANDLAAGELLSQTDVRAPAAPAALRAMSLPIDPARAVGGRLTAGDRVDVIATLDGDTDYVASDLRVLAVSTPGVGGLTGAGTGSLTVAVDEESALALARAVEASTVHVVRSTGASPFRREAAEDA